MLWQVSFSEQKLFLNEICYLTGNKFSKVKYLLLSSTHSDLFDTTLKYMRKMFVNSTTGVNAMKLFSVTAALD